jgi:hypothetical protein
MSGQPENQMSAFSQQKYNAYMLAGYILLFFYIFSKSSLFPFLYRVKNKFHYFLLLISFIFFLSLFKFLNAG